MTLLEAIEQLQDQISKIESQDKLINMATTVAGGAIGGIIGSSNDHVLVGTGLGGGLGALIASSITSNRVNNYIDNVTFGPYRDEIETLLNLTISLINEISELHKDYNYKTKYLKNIDVYNTCIQKYTELKLNKIQPYRKCIINVIESNLKIIESYCKEKRAHPDVIVIYKNDLIPKFKIIEHYLLNSKVKI